MGDFVDVGGKFPPAQLLLLHHAILITASAVDVHVVLLGRGCIIWVDMTFWVSPRSQHLQVAAGGDSSVLTTLAKSSSRFVTFVILGSSETSASFSSGSLSETLSF